MSTSDENKQKGSKLNTMVIAVTVIIVLVVLSYIYVTTLKGRSIASDNPVHAPYSFEVTGDLFSYVRSESKPILNREELLKSLTNKLNTHVYIAPVDGSSLWIVLANGQLFYTDHTGSLLLQGSVFSLDRDEVLSERFAAEYRYSKNLVKARQSTKVPVNDYLGVPRIEKFEEPMPEKLKNIPLHSKAETVKTDVQPIESSDVKTDAELIDSNEFELVQLAQNLKWPSDNFSEQCLKIAMGFRSIDDLTRVMGLIPSEQAKMRCGLEFGSHSFQSFGDGNLAVYKAHGEQKAYIDIMSDYTCSFCARFHKRIPELNAAGITVRVFPYSRHDYYLESGKDPSPIAVNMGAVMCAPEEKRSEVFDDLMSNWRKYQFAHYEKVNPTDQCVSRAISYRMIGDVFNSKRQTPLIFYSNGESQIGDTITNVDDIIAKALKV